MDKTILDGLKSYLRIEIADTDSDAELTELYTAAVEYLQRTTRRQYDQADALWSQAVKLLVTHWYTNRQIEGKGATTGEYSHTLTAIQRHLAICDDYPVYTPGGNKP